MAQFVKLECSNKEGKKISFEIPWWIPDDLLKNYNFKEVVFAGEIDYELEVGKGTLKKIQIEQERNASKFLFKPEISKKIDEICDYGPEIKIVLNVFVWYSGY